MVYIKNSTVPMRTCMIHYFRTDHTSADVLSDHTVFSFKKRLLGLSGVNWKEKSGRWARLQL